MEGYEVVTMEDAAPRADIFVTATGNKDIITLDHMRAMKDRAIVCNIGHFDNEIQVAGLKNFKWNNIKPQVDEIEFPDGKRIILLSEGPPGEPRQRDGPPVVRHVGVVHQPDAGADRAVHQPRQVQERRSIRCPSTSTRRSRRLHLAKIGVQADEAQRPSRPPTSASSREGPFKPDHYRY